MSTLLVSPVPRPPRSRRPRVGSDLGWVIVLAVVAAALRLPFVTQPLGPDEGGFLLVAAQWAPGRSLYGNYWVDRPPLLLDFFRLADQLGGAVALRVLGASLVAASVLLAGRIGAVVAPVGRRSTTSILTAATAAVFLVNPLFGAPEVSGELIATPLVLLGILLALEAAARESPDARRWLLLGAGAAGAAAVLVKQNEIDVLVFLGIGALTVLRRHGRALADLATAAAGAAAVTIAELLHAWTRGTTPSGLWAAIVTFRLRASEMISSSASPATDARLHHLLLALTISGAPLLVLQLLLRLRATPAAGSVDLRWLAGCLLAWETVSVLAGGSYWPHYLICLVPGLVLAVATVDVARPSRRFLARRHPSLPVLTVVAAVALTSLGYLGGHLSSFQQDAPLTSWLSAHAGPHDTAVIAYGHAEVLQAAGLNSPYPELWSLPVKVRDPRLTTLAAVLSGQARPDWLVTTGASLDAWGVDSTAGEVQLAAHYVHVADVDGNHVYHRVATSSP